MDFSSKENNRLLKPTIEKMKHKPVLSIEGTMLGLLEDVDHKYITIKKDIQNSIYYRVPTKEIKTYDGNSLWISITQTEALQYLLPNETTIYNGKTEYETVTFRLAENITDAIHIESKSRVTSINHLANIILRRYMENNILESHMGIMFLTKPVAVELFKKKSEKEVIDVAKNIAKNSISNSLLFTSGKIDLKVFLQWLERQFNERPFNFRHLIEHNHHIYIIRHELGFKYSLYLKTIIEEFLKDYLEKEPNFTISDEVLVFRFINQK